MTQDAFPFNFIRKSINTSTRQAFAHNLLRMEFTSILEVLRLLDSGTAAENISVTIPHQFLNPYKCQIEMSYIVVLSSTTNSSNIFDDGKHSN